MGKKFPHFLRVSAIHYKPFFEIPSKSGEKPAGIDHRLLETLSEALKFEYELVTPEDNEWGRLKGDGNWTGMIGMVSRGQADIATCSPAITADRQRAVDFTVSYINTDSAFATSLPRLLPHAYTYWYPFDVYTWSCIFALLFLVPLGFCLLSKRRFTYLEVLLTVFGNLLGKSQSNRALGGKYVATCWCLCATLISFSYSAVVSSFLFKPLLHPQVQNMEELAKELSEGQYKVYVWKGSFQIELMLDSPFEHLNQIARAIRKNKWYVNVKEGLNQGFYQDRVAFIDGRIALNLRYGIPPLRTKFISRDGCANVHAAIAVRKDFCCKDALDRVLNRIIAAGLHNKFLSDEIFRSWLSGSKMGLNSEKYDRRLSLDDLSGAMFVLLAGYCASFFAFVAEILHKRCIK